MSVSLQSCSVIEDDVSSIAATECQTQSDVDEPLLIPCEIEATQIQSSSSVLSPQPDLVQPSNPPPIPLVLPNPSISESSTVLVEETKKQDGNFCFKKR